MQRKILYIVNPISGPGIKNSIENTIAAETLKIGIPFRFVSSAENGDYTFLNKTILKEKITDVIIVGGDGTVSQVIDSFRNYNLQFGIVPAGSGNGLAFSAGISKYTQKALQVIFENKTIMADGFRINGKFACMLCGIGFDAQVAHDFAGQSERGLTTYIKQVIKNFFIAKPYRFKIKIHDSLLQFEAFFISIANSNQFGNHFTIAPKASLNDGLLDIVIVTEQSKLSLVYNTMLQVGGLNELTSTHNIDQNKGIIYFQTSEINIINCDLAPMHVDGDPVKTCEEIQAVIMKNCFKLLAHAQ